MCVIIDATFTTNVYYYGYNFYSKCVLFLIQLLQQMCVIIDATFTTNVYYYGYNFNSKCVLLQIQLL